LIEQEKLNEVIAMTMKLGFNMGAVAMRLKMMETLMPYLDASVLASELLTTKDVIKMMADTMTEFDNEDEYNKLKDTMKGLNGNDFPPQI
jgi:hypothetical protein